MNKYVGVKQSVNLWLKETLEQYILKFTNIYRCKGFSHFFRKKYQEFPGFSFLNLWLSFVM